MTSFDHILPPEILSRLDSKIVDIDLVLNSVDCEQRWPLCKITIGDQEIFNGPIVEQKSIKANRYINDLTTTIGIEYYGKSAQDTKTDGQNRIIANQMIGISEFKLNGIDIIKNGLIYRANYLMELDHQKEKYFREHNIPTVTNDYHFYENGRWSLQIEIPVLSYIINITKQVETFEKIPYDDIIDEIIKKLEI